MAAILAGHRLGVRDRPVLAADRARPGAERPRATARTPTPTARCGSSPTTRAAMSFLIADGVVPVQRGPRLRPAPADAAGDPPGPPDRHRAGLPAALRRRRARADGRAPTRSCIEHAETIDMWLAREEEAFGHTLEQGTRILDEHIARAKAARRRGHRRRRGVPAARHLRLPVRPHARARGRAGAGRRRAGLRGADGAAAHARARERAAAAGATRTASARARSRGAAGFDTDVHRLRDRRADHRGRRGRPRATAACWSSSSSRRSTPPAAARSTTPARSAASPATARRRVTDVLRLGDDQVLVLEPVAGELHEGERVVALVDRAARRATECQPHRHAPAARGAARARSARTCARPAPTSGPTSCASTSPTARRCRAEDVARGRGPRQRVDARQPARARAHHDARRGARARRDGAVRREVRRRRADGRGRRRRLVARAVRRHARALDRRDRRLQADHGDLERGQRAPHRGDHRARWRSSCCAARPRARRGRAGPAHASRTRSPSVVAEREAKRRELEKQARRAAPVDAGCRRGASTSTACKVVVEMKDVADPKLLPDIADRIKGQLGDPSVIVLGATGERPREPARRRHARRGRARREGGRDRQGRRPGRGRGRRRARQHGAGRRPRPREAADALEARASEAIRASRSARAPARPRARLRQRPLWRRRVRSDAHARHAARAGPAARPRAAAWPPGGADRARARGRASWWSGCRSRCRAPIPTRRARPAHSSERLRDRLNVPIEVYDERFTTKLAHRAGGATAEDSRAAAVLLEGWLTRERSAARAPGPIRPQAGKPR